MIRPSSIGLGFALLGWACAATPPPPCAEAPAAPAPSFAGPVEAPPAAPVPGVAPSAAPAASASAPTPASAQPIPFEPPLPDTPDPSLVARANGPAVGGPRGARPCAFHESVDTYKRQCVAKVNPDGSILVTAKGTHLNPDNGFEFTMHGGEQNQWAAKGTLKAFAHCDGPFVGLVNMVIDNGVKTYDVRFKKHCMISIR